MPKPAQQPRTVDQVAPNGPINTTSPALHDSGLGRAQARYAEWPAPSCSTAALPLMMSFTQSLTFVRGWRIAGPTTAGLVWLAGQVLISYLGRYHSPLASPVLPEWIDLLVVAAFSTVIYYLAVASTLSTSMVATLVEAEAQEAAVAPALSVAG